MPWPILGTAGLLAFAMITPMFAIPPMEHILNEELQLTHAETGLLFTVPIIMLAALAIPAGLVADRIGVRKAAGIGVILIVVGALLRSTATSASALLAFTFIYGVGFGWVFPNLPKLVSTHVPRERVGFATGIYLAGLPIGAALALALTMPLVFPLMNSYQGVFFFWSIPAIVAAALWWILVKEPSRTDRRDTVVSEINRITLQRILKRRELWVLSSSLLLHSFFVYSWAGWSPALMMLKGATPELAGVIASTTLWAAAPAFILMPRLAGRLGLRKPFIWVPSVVTAIVAGAAINAPLQMGWLLMILAGISDGAKLTTTMTVVVETTPKEEVGLASGLVLSIGYVGGIIGPLVGGRVLDLTGNLDLSLIILVVVSAVAAGIVFKLPETGPRAKKS
jgi:CP family cyanate transporter-like MFS transporter